VGLRERLRRRGGLLSGSLLLAGFSAVLLSALAVIGLRTVAGPAAQPGQVTRHDVTGDVSVPDTSDTATAARARHESRPVTLTVPPTSIAVTSSRVDGASVSNSPRPGPGPSGSPLPRPTTPSAPKPSPTVTATPTPSPSHGRGHAHAHGHNR